ncbi:hypothetical protein AMK28_34210 [Streptomyces sp. CB02115]|nr:hypothetical protein AMK28_34210 [Streptomyces sp. CB02115]
MAGRLLEPWRLGGRPSITTRYSPATYSCSTGHDTTGTPSTGTVCAANTIRHNLLTPMRFARAA